MERTVILFLHYCTRLACRSFVYFTINCDGVRLSFQAPAALRPESRQLTAAEAGLDYYQKQ